MTRKIVAAIGATPEDARAQISALGPSLEGGPAPSVGEVLTWDGTAWVPGAGGGGGGVASVSADSPLASSGGLNPAISLSAGTSIGDIIRWNGTTWVVYSPPAPVTPVTSVSASSPLASSGGTTPDISLDAGASAGDLLTWNGTFWAGATPAAGYWSKSVTELSPLTAGDTVAVEIGAGTAGVTVTDTLASVSSELRPGFVSLADNVKLAELSATGASLLLQGDSGDLIPVIPALVARDFDTSPTTLDLQIGGLTLNAAAGAAGEVLTSNGSGAAPTWQAGGGGSISALTGDVTASGPGSAAATVAAMQGYAVSIAAPTNGQVLGWNGTAWVPTQPSASGGGGVTYNLNNIAAQIPTTGIPGTPLELGVLASGTTTTITTPGHLPTGGSYVLVAGFLTPVSIPNMASIPGGVWDFNIWALTNASQVNTVLFRVLVYKYDGAALTLLATGIAAPLTDPLITLQYTTSVLMPQVVLATTDRIYVAIEATATVTNRHLTLSLGGITPSHAHTTFPGVAGGDLSGNYPDPTVIALQGHSVSTTAPTSNQILQWISGTSKWTPTANGVGLGSKVLLVVEGGAYATIQDAINAAVDWDVILVGPKAAGASWGPVTLSPGKRLAIEGLGDKWSTQVKVDSITFNVSSGTILPNTVVVRGLYISGSFVGTQGVNFYGASPGRLHLQECYVYNTGATGSGVVSDNSNAASALYLDNCLVQSGSSGGIGLDHRQGYTDVRGDSEISRYQYPLQCAGGTVEVSDTILDGSGIANEVVHISGGLVTVGYSTIKNSTTNSSGVNLTTAGAAFGMGDATFAIATGTGFCVTGVPGAYFLYGHVSYSHSALVAYNVRVKTTGGITPVATTQAYTAV